MDSAAADIDVKSDEKPPFSSFTFTFHDVREGREADRAVFSMERLASKQPSVDVAAAADVPMDAAGIVASAVSSATDASDGDKPGYKLHVERGSADGPHVGSTRNVPVVTARLLKKRLDEVGAFSWNASYGSGYDADAASVMKGAPVDDGLIAITGKRWKLSVVFLPGVFEYSSEGGDRAPEGLKRFLEVLYGFGLPRPGDASTMVDRGPAAFGQGGGVTSGFGIGGGTGSFQGGLPGGSSAAMDQMRRAIESMQENPAEFERFARSQFRALPPDQQGMMLDMLGASGIESREWWERFLRGF